MIFLITKCTNIQATAATGIHFQFFRSLYIRKKLLAVGIRIHHVKVFIITSSNGCGLGDRILLIKVILSLIHIGSSFDFFVIPLSPVDIVYMAASIEMQLHLYGGCHVYHHSKPSETRIKSDV
jgi:hypothetical protein